MGWNNGAQHWFILANKVKVMELVYSHEFAVAAIHAALQVSHYLPLKEFCQTFNKEFALSVQYGSN